MTPVSSPQARAIKARASSTAAILIALNAPTIAQHVADFQSPSNVGSPLGLSRRAYLTPLGTPSQCEPAISPYDRAFYEWGQQCLPGRVAILNSDPNRLLVSDVGAGNGDATLPGPLVAGGAMAVNSGLKGFGPYGVPFVLETFYIDFSKFEAAGAFSGAGPASYPFSGWKTAGVVLSVDNVEAGATVDRIVVAGVRVHPASGVRLLDVYTHNLAAGTFTSVASQPFALPTQTGSLNLRVTVQATRILVTALQGSTTLGQASASRVAIGVPAQILRVTAGATRVGGIVSSDSVDIGRISVTAPNVVAFSGAPAGPTAPLNSPAPMVRRLGGQMIAGGNRYEASGVNRVDLLNYFAGFEATDEYGKQVLDTLQNSSDLRVVRFAATDEFAKYSKAVGAPEWPRVNLPLLDLFQADPSHERYFAAFDALVSAATARGIKLVPVLCWDPRVPYAQVAGIPVDDVTKHQVRQMFNLEPVVDPISQQARALLQSVVTAVAGRYSGHSTILCWEVGNEWDNNLDPAQLTKSAGWPWLWDSFAECGAAVRQVANMIRAVDTQHMIGGGYAGAASLWKNGGSCATTANFNQALKDLHPAVLDLVSFHPYVGATTSSTCNDWLPSPFPSFDVFAAEARNAALALHTGSDPARVLYFGETNWTNTWSPCASPYDQSQWAQVCAWFSGVGAGNASRSQLTMLWEFMRVPHDTFPGSVWESHNATAADLSVPGSRVGTLETSLVSTAAAPRIARAGFNLLYATATTTELTMVARVEDGQADDTSIRVLNAAGTQIGTLTKSGGIYSGNVTVAALPVGQEHFVRLEAVDAKGHTSRRWPHLVLGAPTAPGVGILGAPAVNFGAPGNGTYPKIRSAGYAGFEHVGVDGGRVHFSLEVSNENGLPLTGAVQVFGRFPTPGLSPLAGWATGPNSIYFNFSDNGTEGDVAAGDGIWTASLPVPTAAFSHNALLAEFVVFHMPAGSGALSSDFWPRALVH